MISPETGEVVEVTRADEDDGGVMTMCASASSNGATGIAR